MLLTTTAIAGSLAAGCSRSTSPNPASGGRNTASAAEPEKAFVRLEDLVSRHPLQAELQRLDEAALLLRRAVAASGNAVPSEAVSLVAMGTAEGRGAAASVDSLLAQQRAAARSRLSRRAERGIEEYAASLTYRRQRREEQRRAELEAVARARVSEEERRQREAVETELRNRLFANADEYTNLKTKQGALENSLNPVTSSLLPPTVTPEKLKEDLALLQQQPLDKVKVTDWARLTRDLREVETQLAALRTREQEALARGRQDIADALARIRQQSAAEIEARLRELRLGADPERSAAEERARLQQVLEFEARIAALAVRDRSRREGALSALQPLELPEPEATTGAGLGIAGALARIAAQRARVAAFVRADVTDAVRDAAAARNIDVSFEGNNGGRVDRTNDFLKWVIQPMRSTDTDQGGDTGSTRARRVEGG